MSLPQLVFTLHAPHGAWGAATLSAANTAWRATELAPGLSHVVGLLGAALGWPRERLGALAEGLHLAVREVIAPVRDPAPDYHTITPPTPPPVRVKRGWTRWEELRPALGAAGGSVLSWREYWTGGLWLVALHARADAEPGLDALAAALAEPCHPLFAGRRACPLGLPPDPELVREPGPAEAFARYRLPWERHPELRSWIEKATGATLLVDEDYPGRPPHRRMLERRDRPLPGLRRFGTRGVAECVLGG